MTHIATLEDKAGLGRGPSGYTPGQARESVPAELSGPPVKGSFGWVGSMKRSLTGEAVSPKLLLVMTSQLSVMLSSGCDLCAGLDALSKQESHAGLKKVLVDLHQKVKQGKSFSQALASHPEVFSQLYVTMVRAGESAGLLKHMLQTLQLMARNQMKITGSIRSALMYPIILICVAVGAITVMTTFVLPRFAALFEQSNIPLPTVTKFVIGTSTYVRSHIVTLALGAVLAIVGILWLVCHPSTRPFMHKWALKIPLLGKTMQLSYVCRSIQTMGMLIKSGLPLAEALVLTRDMMPNLYYWRFFEQTRHHISEGKQLSSDFDATTLFPPMVTQMISVGEQTGTMSQVCLEIASFHEEELHERIKAMVTALEPIIILLMGGFVGFIAISVILPMFKLSSSVH